MFHSGQQGYWEFWEIPNSQYRCNGVRCNEWVVLSGRGRALKSPKQFRKQLHTSSKHVWRGGGRVAFRSRSAPILGSEWSSKTSCKQVVRGCGRRRGWVGSRDPDPNGIPRTPDHEPQPQIPDYRPGPRIPKPQTPDTKPRGRRHGRQPFQ